jgi:hypothetical protein
VTTGCPVNCPAGEAVLTVQLMRDLMGPLPEGATWGHTGANV